jgi:hypothetical protein
MNSRDEGAKTKASDELTVHWWESSVYPMVHWRKTVRVWSRSLKHRMNRRSGSGSSDGRWNQDREQLVADVSAPNEPMVNGIKATVHPTP